MQLKNRFLLYNLSNILKLSSVNAIKIYEILKMYEGVKRKTFEVEELKEMLGVQDNYRNKYSNFRTKVLLAAQKSLKEHTDICFDFEEISESSRRVQRIIFHIHKNNPNQNSTPSTPITSEDKTSDVFVKLQSWGITEQAYQEMQNQYTPSYILQTYDCCKVHFKKNPPANKA